ncbi:MAG TPA: class I adenylate-forming enzyme family protein [Candidatus Sulfotelmatobacter sp.]|nr:class I adenylate-forming enzyme family protein [Candidatus Sulfotelmatobacter sp.]
MDTSAYLYDPRPHADRSVLRPVTFGALFDATTARRPEAVAAIEDGRRSTWAELATQTDRLGGWLAARGIGRGDVVGLHLPNGVAYVVAHAALAKLGAVLLTLHPAYREHELRAILAHARARALFCPASAADRLAPLSAELGLLTIPVGDPARGFAAIVADTSLRAPAWPPVAPDDPMALLPTSGTESLRPKITMHAHEGLLSNADQVARDANVGEDDVFLSASGFTHAFGLLSLHLCVLRGGRFVALPKWDPARLVALVRDEGVTRAWAVPAQLADLLVLLGESAIGAPALREVRTGGAAVPAAFVRGVRAAFGCELIVQWGMSELGAGCTTGAGDPEAVVASTIGRPLAGARARAADAHGGEVAPGESGEFLYCRADMFRGYLDEPELTAAAFTPDGTLRTGDVVALVDAGRVAFRGRTKDLINRGGMKISAYELEAHLVRLPQVRQLAVVAYADERLGERVCCVVSLHDGHALALDDVLAYLDGADVAKYKWPERLLVLAALPTTPSGKVHKAAVRELVLREEVVAG